MSNPMSNPAFHPTAIERAFALVETGRYMTASAVKLQLQHEGYSTAQIVGPALLRQIRSICMRANKRKP